MFVFNFAAYENAVIPLASLTVTNLWLSSIADVRFHAVTIAVCSSK